MTAPLEIGFLLFPGLTQLDLTGPFEVLSKLPGARTHLAWKTLDPVVDASGLRLLPSVTLAACPPLDVLCVPGGGGVSAVMEDDEALAFVRSQAAGARFVTSVCSGSLVLAAAGLLRGRRAACHWASRDMLSAFGAVPDPARVVRDDRYVTGGGVTAGIDFGLVLAAELAGEDVAREIQLRLEYAPDPPFRAGRPEDDPALAARVKTSMARQLEERRAIVDRLTR